ncbi:hypothetical protein ACJX0J_016231, partial [Zea mays]
STDFQHKHNGQKTCPHIGAFRQIDQPFAHSCMQIQLSNGQTISQVNESHVSTCTKFYGFTQMFDKVMLDFLMQYSLYKAQKQGAVLLARKKHTLSLLNNYAMLSY